MYIDLTKLIERLEPQKVKNNKILGILKYDEREDTKNYIKSIERKAQKIGVSIVMQDLRGVLAPFRKVEEVSKISDAILPIKPFPFYIGDVLGDTLDCYKDVDNFSNKNVFPNCTAEAVLEILKFLNISADKHVLVIGRHVGLEIFNMLLRNDYTVSIAHSKTKNLELLTQNADIIVSCTGVKNLIKKDMVKVNSYIIDVGLGDVDLEVIEKANVTPAREGVGAVTTNILFQHVLRI